MPPIHMTDIVLLGEAWGEYEERERMAFIGYTGQELNRMLSRAKINRADCHATNVFNLRPSRNDISTLCGPKNEALPGYPALVKGQYVHRRFFKELQRLRMELGHHAPNIVIALGNTACWAMLGKTAITKIRGVVQMSTHTLPGIKVLPTFHPAAVTRQYNLGPVTIADLIKAKRESEFPEIRRPKRTIWIEPTLEDLYEFDKLYLSSAERLSVDIETAGQVITCIGFAPTPDMAIVIPGIGFQRAGRAYWPSVGIERKVLHFIKEVLKRPVPKVFQNGLYDIAFLWRVWGIKVYNAEDDTMLLHHALQPESLKSLGFLGSVYTNEGAWKQMREAKTIKRED